MKQSEYVSVRKTKQNTVRFKPEPIWIYLFYFHLQLKRKGGLYFEQTHLQMWLVHMMQPVSIACQFHHETWSGLWRRYPLSWENIVVAFCVFFIEMSQKEAFPTCWHHHHVRSMPTRAFCCFLAPGFPEHYLYSSSFDDNRPISQKKLHS